MKKVLFIATILFFALAISSCSSEEIIQDKLPEALITTKDNNSKAHESGRKLLEFFGISKTRSLNDSEYPDYYGGGFINEQGKLVVFLKGELDTIKSILTNAIGENDIIYKKGNYSYTELKDVLRKISSFIDYNKESLIADNIKYYYLDDFKNNIVVELNIHGENETKLFQKEVTNFTGIVFKQCTREFKNHALSPGSSIGTLNGNATMGYRATRYNSDGFVTAGHAYDTGDPAYYNGVHIGNCDYSIQGGSVDAAFISITDFSNVPSNGDLTGEEYYFWAGESVTKLGQTISKSEGYITSTSANVNAEGISYTDMGEATYLSAPGDSGGPVYLTSGRKIIGIHKGSSTFTATFVKVANIASTLNAHFN